jgi:hypothetical protein
MTIGQRYDVIINGDQAPGNFWFRAEAATACASTVNFAGRAIFSYSGVPPANPTSNGTAFKTDCAEPSPLTPWWPQTIPSADFQSQARSLAVDLTVPNVTTNNLNIVSWTVNLTAIRVDWRDPTLSYVYMMPDRLHAKQPPSSLTDGLTN